MGRTSRRRPDYASFHDHRVGGSWASPAPQLSLDLCAARFELEPESLPVTFACTRLQRLHRPRYRWRGSWLDRLRGGNSVQCRGCCFCNRHCQIARSNWRGAAETRVLVPTVEANDKLDYPNYAAHHG